MPQPSSSIGEVGAISAGKIASIETFHIAVPATYAGPAPRGTRQWPRVEMLVIRMETDKGFIGWGEAFGHRACATTKTLLDTMIVPLCIGAEAGDILSLGEKLTRTMHPYGLASIVAYALAGVDMALWDIRGKALGSSIHQLLGSDKTEGSIPAYASLLRYGDADLVGEASADAVARGHSKVKLHEATLDAVQIARSAIGDDIDLMLDVNCRWTHDEALSMARDLMPYNLRWIEEPCWPPTPEMFKHLTAETGIPIAAGENAISFDVLEDLGASEAVAFIQPSAAKLGGISGLLKAAKMVEGRKTKIATHSAYFGPGLASTIQFCAAIGLPGCEWYDCQLEQNPFGLKPENGSMAFTNAPGLGLRVDESALSHYRVG